MFKLYISANLHDHILPLQNETPEKAAEMKEHNGMKKEKEETKIEETTDSPAVKKAHIVIVMQESQEEKHEHDVNRENTKIMTNMRHHRTTHDELNQRMHGKTHIEDKRRALA